MRLSGVYDAAVSGTAVPSHYFQFCVKTLCVLVWSVPVFRIGGHPQLRRTDIINRPLKYFWASVAGCRSLDTDIYSLATAVGEMLNTAVYALAILLYTFSLLAVELSV